MRPFIYASDLHGIEQDRKVVRSFLKFVDDFDPKAVKIFGGDLWNFAALRRQADEHEKSLRLKEDFEAGIEFLELYRPSYLILGNHDQRLWDAVKRERVKRSGWRAELAETYIQSFTKTAAAMNIKVLPYDKRLGVLNYGGLAFAHGFGSGDTMGQKMAETYGNVLYGHGHKIERVTAMHTGRPVTGYQNGCLCRDDMDYARADLGALRQEQGWAYGFLAPHAEVFQARFSRGRAIVAAGFKEV